MLLQCICLTLKRRNRGQLTVFLPYIYVASFTNKDTSMVLEIDKAIKVRT